MNEIGISYVWDIPEQNYKYLEEICSLFSVKISRKVEEILFQWDKTEKPLWMAFWSTSEASASN